MLVMSRDLFQEPRHRWMLPENAYSMEIDMTIDSIVSVTARFYPDIEREDIEALAQKYELIAAENPE